MKTKFLGIMLTIFVLIAVNFIFLSCGEGQSKFEGIWSNDDGEMIFKGDIFIELNNGRELYRGTFSVDDSDKANTKIVLNRHYEISYNTNRKIISNDYQSVYLPIVKESKSSRTLTYSFPSKDQLVFGQSGSRTQITLNKTKLINEIYKEFQDKFEEYQNNPDYVNTNYLDGQYYTTKFEDSFNELISKGTLDGLYDENDVKTGVFNNGKLYIFQMNFLIDAPRIRDDRNGVLVSGDTLSLGVIVTDSWGMMSLGNLDWIDATYIGADIPFYNRYISSRGVLGNEKIYHIFASLNFNNGNPVVEVIGIEGEY